MSNTIDKGYESAIMTLASGKAYVRAKVDAITPQPVKQAQAKVNSVVEKIPEPVKITAKTVAAPIIAPNPVVSLAVINPLAPPTDPEEFLKYNYGVKQGLVDNLTAIPNMIDNFDETAAGIQYAATHKKETCQVIAQQAVGTAVDDILLGDSESRGRFIGQVAPDVALTAAAISKINWTLRGGKIVKVSAAEAKLLQDIGETGIKKLSTVEDLIEMINKRPGVEARFAVGDEAAYLEYIDALGSHMLMEDGTSIILIKKTGSTRWTVFHEYMHRVLQSKNGVYMPGEDEFIEAFLKRHKEVLKLE